MATILLTDGEQRSTLAVTRSLGRAGHEVVVGSEHEHSLAGASRYASASVLLPEPTGSRVEYRSAVADGARRTGAELLIPMTDASAQHLLGLHRELPGLQIPFPDRAIYEALSDKGLTAKVARSLGIAVPEQVLVASREEGVELARRAEAGIGFPRILKPTCSVTEVASGVMKTQVRTVVDPGELTAGLEAYPAEAYPILVQQQVVGPGAGIFFLRWDGRTVAAFAHRRLRERPPQGGVSVYRESVPVDPSLLEAAEALLGAFELQGVAMVELKRDEATRTPYLMEVNARFWGSLQLAIDAGVDFPRLLVELATGHDVEPVLSWRTGIRSRWLWGDVDHLLAVLRAGPRTRRRHPGYPRRLGAVGRFLLPWRPGDRYEILRPSDPGPFVRETVKWFGALA